MQQANTDYLTRLQRPFQALQEYQANQLSGLQYLNAPTGAQSFTANTLGLQ